MTDRLLRPLALLLGALALSAGLVACGEKDEDKPEQQSGRVPSPTLAAPKEKAYAQPAALGDAEAPAPEKGEVVADSGFDRSRDGFSFENYGVSLGGPEIRAREVRELFGDKVCVKGSGGCKLTPEAESWRRWANTQFGGGHCYGFSLLALQLRSGAAKAGQYGGSTTYDLEVSTPRGLITNDELHADFARSAAMQFVKSVTKKFRFLNARQALEELQRGLPGGNGYVLGMFAPRGAGGHAVNPIAVEDLGGGRYDVVLYDNNHPYVASAPAKADRRLRIDTNKNTWSYSASLNPNAAEADYHGEGETNKLMLVREEDQRLPQPCPFCKSGSGRTTTVGLGGDAANHGHLRITDAEGRVIGYENGKLVNEIPGAEVLRPYLNQVWLADPEPNYQLPAGRRYTVELVDVPADAPEQTLHASGRDLGVGLSGLTAAADGTKLSLGVNGTVGLDPSGADAVGGLLSVGAPGDRELRIDPSGARLRVKRTGGDVRLTGSAEKVQVVDVASGEKATASKRTGTLDLSRLVGGAG